MGNTRVYSYAVGDAHCLEVSGVGTFQYEGNQARVTVFAEPGVPASAMEEAFHRDVLPVVMQAAGLNVVHGSAVQTAAGVVVFCADSGTGKSTLAYGLDARGYRIWADDAVAFTLATTELPFVMAVPLPFQSSLRPASRDYFGLDGSASLPFSAAPPADDEPSPIAAFCLLSRRAASPDVASAVPIAVSRCSSSAAFLALLAQTLALRPEDVSRRRQMTQDYLSVAEHVPVFRMTFMPGFDVFPAVLDAIERQILRDPMIGPSWGRLNTTDR